MDTISFSDLTRDARLAGRTAVVTGASSGIGEAVAHVLASSGAHVVVHGRDQTRSAAVAAAIVDAGGAASVVLADLSASDDAVRDFARRVRASAGDSIDILVNNAGVYPVGPTEKISGADVADLLATNVRVPHELVAAFAPAMAERGAGSIVNIASWMGRVGTSAAALYPATKAALEHLTRGWAAEYGPRGVRVNSVAPGVIQTPGNAWASEYNRQMTASTPAAGPGRPIDVAWAVRYLASDEAAFVHGASLVVDGGISATRPM